MTTVISIKDAAILAHLSKQPSEGQRILLTSRLGEEAKKLAPSMRNTTMTSAEQFLAKQGIKFRAVPSERGPGEWNVTFSRKGGGRLKLDYYQSTAPTLRQVVDFLIMVKPNPAEYEEDEMQSYIDDCKEYVLTCAFFTDHEIQDLLHLQCELTG